MDKTLKPALFAQRWKTYASWPVVLFCRLARHRHGDGGTYSIVAGEYERCVRCGDPLAERLKSGGVNKRTCPHYMVTDGKGEYCPICGEGM